MRAFSLKFGQVWRGKSMWLIVLPHLLFMWNSGSRSSSSRSSSSTSSSGGSSSSNVVDPTGIVFGCLCMRVVLLLNQLGWRLFCEHSGISFLVKQSGDSERAFFFAVLNIGGVNLH